MLGLSHRPSTGIPRSIKKRKQSTLLYLKNKHIRKIMNCGQRSATRWLDRARKRRGKVKGQLITVKDFCIASGLPESMVLKCLP
jgi:hypothetical protein